MTCNVMPWKEALKKGYEPGLYPFSWEHIPVGEYTAQLDFKIWAKKIMGISCYFTQAETRNKFQLTVYCSGSGRYRLSGCDVDFVTCPTGCLYFIHVFADQKKKIVLKNVVRL